jgi:uncharacterized BrkB/YihY/UPF0761 family membrane protein
VLCQCSVNVGGEVTAHCMCGGQAREQISEMVIVIVVVMVLVLVIVMVGLQPTAVMAAGRSEHRHLCCYSVAKVVLQWCYSVATVLLQCCYTFHTVLEVRLQPTASVAAERPENRYRELGS